MNKKGFVDRKISNLVTRRDYSKIEKNFDEPNLLNLQKKAFDNFIENQLEDCIKKFFPITLPQGRYSLNFVGINLKAPKRTEKDAKNEGKSYERALYVDLVVVDKEKGETKRAKAKTSDGIFFVNIPIMTKRGTFIVNGVEKFIIAQIVRSPGAYVLTKAQMKLSNSRKRILEGTICEILPTRGNLFFIFIPENKNVIQAMFRTAVGESTHVIPITILLKILGLNTKKILDIFDHSPLIRNTLDIEEYNEDALLESDEYKQIKNASIRARNDTNKYYGIETTIRRLFKQYYDLKELQANDPTNNSINNQIRDILDDLVTEKAAKDLVLNLSISTKNVNSSSKKSTKEASYQSIIINHFFNQKNFDLSNAGRFKLSRKLRLSERLYQKVLAEDIIDETGKVVIEKNTLIQKEELDLILKLASNSKKNNFNYSYKIKHDSPGLEKEFFIEKIRVYADNDLQDIQESIIGTNSENEKLSLAVSDIVSITSYVSNIRNNIGQYDDIDHLGNKRLKLIDELLKLRTEAGLVRIEKFVLEKLITADIATKTTEEDPAVASRGITVKSIINTKPIQISYKEFFNSYQLTQFLDQQNPLAELTNKRRISAMGPGGISREDPNLDIRDVHYSHYGKICPIETPEGMNIGLIMSLATYATVDKNGFLICPYKVVKDGVITDEVKWLTALSEDEYIIACSNINVVNNRFQEKKVLCRYRSAWEYFEPEKVNFIDIASKQVVSIAASSIPFLENDDANRALMGANMQRQATPLITSSAPIVGTGNEYKIAHDSGMALVYEEETEGKVTYVDSSTIKIQNQEGEIKYELTKFSRSNQNTCNNQIPIVSVGDTILPSQTIADGAAMNNGELALGKNILLALTTWHGYNYEDAIIISNRLFVEDIFTSIHIVEYTIECLKTKNGDEEITRDIPNVPEEAKTYLDDEGIIMVGATVKEGDVLVGKISPKGQADLTSEEKLMQAIFGDKSKNHRESSLKVPYGGEGTVAMVKRFKVEDDFELNADVIEQIKVYIVQKRKIQVGDKMAGRHGNKGVISKIVPIEDMPHLEDGTPVDIMLSPLAVPSRMNIGQILELHLGLAMRKLALKKLLELACNPNTTKTDLVQWFGITSDYGQALLDATLEVFKAKKIKNYDDALVNFTDFDLTLVLRKIGLPFEKLTYKVSTPVFEGVNRTDLENVMAEAGISPIHSKDGEGKNGKFRLIDGRTGDYFQGDISLGVMYMLKLDHMVDDKIHSRSVGPYSKITQQPLGGKSQNGGQRFGEMEVWALEAYGAAYNLKEILTIKSDDVKGRNLTYNAIIKGLPIPESGLPESFKLLTKQLQGLCLSLNITQGNSDEEKQEPGEFVDINTHISTITKDLITSDVKKVPAFSEDDVTDFDIDQ